MTILEIALALAKFGLQCKIEIQFTTTGITYPRAEPHIEIYTKTAMDSVWQHAGRLVSPSYKQEFLIVPMDNYEGRRLMKATERDT